MTGGVPSGAPIDPPVSTPLRKPGAKRDLTSGPILSTLMIFSLPVLGSNLLQSLSGSVNQFWVSHTLGEVAVSAIGNANLVMLMLFGGVFGVSVASNILIAQNYGAGDLAMTKRVMGTSITFFAILSLLVSVAGFLTSQHILQAMGTPAEAVDDAVIYLRVIFLSVPFLYFFFFFQQAWRAIGDSRTPFYFMGLAVVLDVVLNPMLIRGLWIFPQMGIAGSSTSTLIGQATSLLCMVTMMYYRRIFLMPRWGDLYLLKPDPVILRQMITRGIPMGLQMLVMSSAGMAMIYFVNGYGTVTSAAYIAATQVWAYIQMPALAISAAVSSMAAQNIGAGRWDRVDKIAMSGVFCGLAVTGTFATIIHLLDPLVLRVFLPEGSPSLPIAQVINDYGMWAFVIFTINFAFSGVVRANGAVWVPLLILVIAVFVIRIPFAYLMIPHIGQTAIWISFSLGTVTASVLIILYYRYGNWRKISLIEKRVATGQAADTGMATPAMDEDN